MKSIPTSRNAPYLNVSRPPTLISKFSLSKAQCNVMYHIVWQNNNPVVVVRGWCEGGVKEGGGSQSVNQQPSQSIVAEKVVGGGLQEVWGVAGKISRNRAASLDRPS